MNLLDYNEPDVGVKFCHERAVIFGTEMSPSMIKQAELSDPFCCNLFLTAILNVVYDGVVLMSVVCGLVADSYRVNNKKKTVDYNRHLYLHMRKKFIISCIHPKLMVLRRTFLIER